MHLSTRLRTFLAAVLRRLKAIWRRLFSSDAGTGRHPLGNGLLDPGFYAAQAGTTWETFEQALEHYLTKGAADGLLPHPLIDPAIAHEPARSAALAAAVGSSRPARSHLFSTAYDWTAYVASAPGAAKHPGGVVGHYTLTERRPGDGVALHELVSGDAVDWAAITERATKQARILPKVLKSGLFDVEYYQAQMGVAFSSTRAALWHFLSLGEDAGLAANPLFEPEWVTSTGTGADAYLLRDHLAGDLTTVSTHPHFDPRAYLEQVPDAASHAGGPLGHFLQHAVPESTTWPADPDVAPRGWGDLRTALLADARVFAAQQRLTAWGTAKPWDVDAERAFEAHVTKLAPMAMDAPRSISVVFDLTRATGRTHQRIAKMLDGDYPALEIVAVAMKDDPQLAALDPRVVVVMTISPVHAERINAAVKRSTGEYLHIWHPRDTVRPTFYRRSVVGALAAGTELVYSAVTSAKSHDALVHGEPYEHDGLVWGDYQVVSRTAIVTRDLFDRVGGYDAELPSFADWDFLLRAATLVDPVFLNQIGVEGGLNRLGVRAATRAYEHVVRARELCDWDARPPRADDRVSILIPVYEDWVMTNQAVGAILQTADGHDVEIVLLDNGSRRPVGALIESAHGHEARVVRTRVPRNTNFATGSNLAFLRSSGRRVVFMNNDTIATPGWLDPLLTELDDPTVRAAQPLLLFSDRTVQAAGTVFHHNALPWHFLQGHPLEDVLAAQQTRFSAITAATMACRADEVLDMRGFDPVYANGMEDVDLCLRLVEERGGDFRVALDSVVVHAESQSVGRFDSVGRNRDVFMDRWMRRLPPSDLDKY
ncbi:MAG: glycosyltransferase, partial [Aeromicrobium sp.]